MELLNYEILNASGQACKNASPMFVFDTYPCFIDLSFPKSMSVHDVVVITPKDVDINYTVFSSLDGVNFHRKGKSPKIARYLRIFVKYYGGEKVTINNIEVLGENCSFPDKKAIFREPEIFQNTDFAKPVTDDETLDDVYGIIGRIIGEKYVEQFGITGSITFDGITTSEGNYEAVGAADANVAWSGIGQYNDQVNPCAFLTFLGAIAKDGKGVQPHLVSQIFVGLSKTYDADTVPMKRIMTTATAKTVGEYMRSNVEYKYGDDNFPGLMVCAKTGTGEVGGEKKPNAMLAGFVDDPDCPLAFIVFVEDGGYGANVCIPIASRVLAVCKEVV